MPETSNAVVGPPRDLVGYGRHAPAVKWPGNASLALNFVVNYEEGSEYSWGDGDGRSERVSEFPPYDMRGNSRDFNSESVFEYGSRAGVWRLLRLFREYDVRPTMFATALAVERTPEVGEWIHEHDLDVCSHGWRWEEHWHLTREEEEERIQAAVSSLEKTCGTSPTGWYCRYSSSPNTRELVAMVPSLIYDADAYNDDLPYFVQAAGRRHLVVPYNSLPYNDARFVTGMTPAQYADICKRGIDEYLREGRRGEPKMMTVGLHARLSGQPPRISALREVIEYALQCRDVWLARRVDIARHWMDHAPEGAA